MQDSFQTLSNSAKLFSVYSPLISIFLGLLYYKRLSAVFQILFYLLLYGFINDLITTLLQPADKWLFNNVYFVFETIAMGFIMINIEKRIIYKRIIRIVIIFLIIMWVASAIYNPAVYLLRFNRFVLPVRSTLLSVLAGIMIYDLSGREDYLFKYSKFWVLIGFFNYLFCNMIVLLSISLKLIENTNIMHNIWFIHNIFSGISNMIYAYAFYLARSGNHYATK